MKTTLSSKLADKRLAVLGAGKIGESLLSGLLSSGWRTPEEIVVTGRRRERVGLAHLAICARRGDRKARGRDGATFSRLFGHRRDKRSTRSGCGFARCAAVASTISP